MNRGRIHLYTGDGKGKTTAALGLLLRASGSGMKIVLAQFLKGRDTGELNAMENLSNVTVLRQTKDFGFFGTASDEIKQEIIKQNNTILQEAINLTQAGSCDLLILDEICAAYTLNALDTAMADKLLKEKPVDLELVLTGRDAPRSFIENADYITEFVKHKHPYDIGVSARKGIEY